MSLPANVEEQVRALPDPESAARFFVQFSQNNPLEARKLESDPSLLSDVLALVSFSPLLAATLLQNPKYVSWLNRQRVSAKVRGKDEILESLERFALVNSKAETNVLLARFRRRELLRIYLRDIRNLGTIAEITEEISNLADAILEYALRIARQAMDNRFGFPLETDAKDRTAQAYFCITALGKLGSKELNYASDIDLLFLYSKEGTTSGRGTAGEVTNREYFVKLAELVVRLVGGQSGEGAAYRVDLRLRPNGRVGHLAVSLQEAIDYYHKSARAWERQVMIRSRSSAGEERIYRKFFTDIRAKVFPKNETIEEALQNVLRSKEKINFEKRAVKGFDVKLGRGGIREIEFIAQALQLAYGGRDVWLRAPHTLISLSRLADRSLVSEIELTGLFEAYTFLRRLEHRLQMENGLQTHLVPDDPEKQSVLAKKMGFSVLSDFQAALAAHTKNVDRVFKRVFGDISGVQSATAPNFEALTRRRAPPGSARNVDDVPLEITRPAEIRSLSRILRSVEKSEFKDCVGEDKLVSLRAFSEVSPHFAGMLSANPGLIIDFPSESDDFQERDFKGIIFSELEIEDDFARELSILRKSWSRFLLEIAAFDVYRKITIREAKTLQTRLAEASIDAALLITKRELGRRLSARIDELPVAVLGLGKLGGGGMDYGSDLDLVLVYGDCGQVSLKEIASPEFYTRAAEIFVNTLSGLTRDGHLYRVDLRLRPDGKNGAPAVDRASFLNYLKTRSVSWEWLAYVKLRGAAGDRALAESTEEEARKILHERARNSERSDLVRETLRVRQLLEREKSIGRKGKEVDIKFGEGGLLDVYFAVRFLQLTENVPDSAGDRSTLFTLNALFENGSLSKANFDRLSDGHEFLTELDHSLRLTIGRSTRLPVGNKTALAIIIGRMKLGSVGKLLEMLTIQRLNIRRAFEEIVQD